MIPLQGRLLELVQRLDGLGASPTLVELAQAMEGARLTAADVAPFVHANPRSYNRAPVVVRDQYELLVMTWLPGQGSVPHDHTGSICAMAVVQGEAAEACYRIAPDGYVDLEFEATTRPGEVSAEQDAGVHTVRNASGELLVTVHCYSPPLRDFRRFVPRPDSARYGARGARERMPTVAVVGGGFSGSMTAAQIMRRAGIAGTEVRMALIERRGAVGEGLAYGTRETCHLLNVPAGKMSAWPDRPDDFLAWVQRRQRRAAAESGRSDADAGRAGSVSPRIDDAVLPSDFLPRRWYGEYVRETLLATADDAAGAARLSMVFDEVRRVDRHPSGGWMVHLARGRSLFADAVVLAIGHRPPSDPIGGRWTGPRTRFLCDPWRPFAMDVVDVDEPVVILGSGLTAVDAVLSLAEHKHRGPITLVSRNGLFPHAHAAKPAPPADLSAIAARLIGAPGGVTARMLLAEVRQAVRDVLAAGGDWRSVVDGLRPHTAPLWRAMPTAERRRFLSRLRPFWEVHRHRMASSIAGKVRDLLSSGAIRVIAGRVESATAGANGVNIVVRQRGEEARIELPAGWVLNCTGPMPSNSAESNPVIGSLLVHGLLRSDELALGVETTAGGGAVDAHGREVRGMFIVGTLRKPGAWESTAVPELRQQAAQAAERVMELLASGRTREPQAAEVCEAASHYVI